MSNQLFEANAQLMELERQRNNALNEGVIKSAQLALAGQRIGQLEAEVAELTQKITTLEEKAKKKRVS